MKRLLVLSLIATLIGSVIFCLPASAEENLTTETSIVYLDNGDYIETSITYFETISRAATQSGSKTRSYKNSAGEVMWSVTVYGTFTYNGTTSTCTSASHSTTAPGSYWSIKSASSRKSGYSAIADATATYAPTSTDYSMNVTLFCSPYGILS